MAEIRYRTFVLRPGLFRTFCSPATAASQDKLRSEAAFFINHEIDKGSLVSISEHNLFDTGLTITVWYKASGTTVE